MSGSGFSFVPDSDTKEVMPVNFDAGKLRHRITFQQFNGTLDEYGDPQDKNDNNWTDVATVWAAVDPVSGREFYEAQQSQSDVTHKIRCRYRSGLNTAMRIKFGSRILEIRSIIDWEERHESLLIMAVEVV